MAFGISHIYNFACTVYFDVGRSNILVQRLPFPGWRAGLFVQGLDWKIGG